VPPASSDSACLYDRRVVYDSDDPGQAAACSFEALGKRLVLQRTALVGWHAGRSRRNSDVFLQVVRSIGDDDHDSGRLFTALAVVHLAGARADLRDRLPHLEGGVCRRDRVSLGAARRGEDVLEDGLGQVDAEPAAEHLPGRRRR
jgi:hypothetical protein